jgi:hypothetical protein
MPCLVGHVIDHAGMKRLLRTKASAKTGYLRILLCSTYTSAPDTAGPRLGVRARSVREASIRDCGREAQREKALSSSGVIELSEIVSH